ncbi:DUF2971 domain-containing protein [Wenyingzhuangia sp. IMCC45574]
MRVFKYRPAGETFERDLTAIEENYYWSSHINDLNDPCDTLSDKTKINSFSSWLLKKFNLYSKENSILFQENIEKELSLRNQIGIFSLSKSLDDELLWAHYSDSHKGFCIEYDFNYLIDNKNSYSNVVYKKYPPKVYFLHILLGYNFIIHKSAFRKSKRWEYEKEFRVISKSTGKIYHPPNAIKAIYFGIRMAKNDKDIIVKRLKNRNISFFQMQQIPNTYRFEAKQIHLKDL